MALALAGVAGAMLLDAQQSARGGEHGPEVPVALAQAPDAALLHLPLVWSDLAIGGFAKPATAQPTDEPTGTPPPSAEASPTTSATFPPTATDEPTPTATPAGEGSISGRLLVGGDPAPIGLGVDLGPALLLLRCNPGLPCEPFDRAGVEDGDGRYEFRDPPSVEPSGYYQVQWHNYTAGGVFGSQEYLGRWHGRRIVGFTAGDEVELADIELTNLELEFPPNDIHYSLPVEYRWAVRREAPSESYRWSLYSSCEEVDREAGDFYRTASLGHRATHTVNAPPPGYRMLEKYCWYVHIDDGERGSGWSFYRYKTMWLGFIELMSGWRPGP